MTRSGRQDPPKDMLRAALGSFGPSVLNPELNQSHTHNGSTHVHVDIGFQLAVNAYILFNMTNVLSVLSISTQYLTV